MINACLEDLGYLSSAWGMRTNGARIEAASRTSLSVSHQYIDTPINKPLMNKHPREQRSSLHGCYSLSGSANTHVDVNSESADTHTAHLSTCMK